jgi:hypothetical protein
MFYLNGEKEVGNFENGFQKGFGAKMLANGTLIKSKGLLNVL